MHVHQFPLPGFETLTFCHPPLPYILTDKILFVSVLDTLGFQLTLVLTHALAILDTQSKSDGASEYKEL